MNCSVCGLQAVMGTGPATGATSRFCEKHRHERTVNQELVEACIAARQAIPQGGPTWTILTRAIKRAKGTEKPVFSDMPHLCNERNCTRSSVVRHV